MIGDRRQIQARDVVGKLETVKRHLIDPILESEPAESPIHACALKVREATLALMRAYAAILDYPPPAHYLRDWRTRIEPPGEDAE